MTANDLMAIGVVKALEAVSRADIKGVGFDAMPAVLPMVGFWLLSINCAKRQTCHPVASVSR
ncbi:hypothetical protein KX928_16030 [Roseobacter sp. YSTF-M11]|uniref:Uncharacterized protein n=1 Tax=Roseobacter insulae TaxID=2859783 RepID=A0A9X1FXC8_9RHOB|nr:hypothetical protein [Roseobacter insulae]